MHDNEEEYWVIFLQQAPISPAAFENCFNGKKERTSARVYVQDWLDQNKVELDDNLKLCRSIMDPYRSQSKPDKHEIIAGPFQGARCNCVVCGNMDNHSQNVCTEKGCTYSGIGHVHRNCKSCKAEWTHTTWLSAQRQGSSKIPTKVRTFFTAWTGGTVGAVIYWIVDSLV